jgi:Ca-activated chloride channel family protein
MKKELAVTIILLSLLIGDLSLLARPSTFAAQSSGRKPPKKEKFGSSLKRLKWDPNKQAAVESEQDNQKRSREIGPGDVIKVETNLVVLDLFVTDKTELRALTGLGKDDFVVTEDDVTQQISMFSVGADPSLARSIVLIIDFSSSMSRYLEKSVEAAKILVNRLGPKDEMAIVNDEVELMVGFTGDKKRLKSALDSLKNRPRGAHGSRQLSALFVTLRELSGAGQGRPIIIIQSDGDEIMNLRDQQPRAEGQPSAWEFGLADIQAAVLGTRATIYTLIPGEPLIGAPLEEARLRVRRSMVGEQEDQYINTITPIRVRAQEAITSVADISGGWAAYLESPERSDELYERILADINQRYVIGYYPTNEARDGRLRKVQVEVRGRPEYVVHGRRSYYLTPH